MMARGGGFSGPGHAALRGSLLHLPQLGFLLGRWGPEVTLLGLWPQPLLGPSEVVDGVKGSGLRHGSCDVQPSVQGALGRSVDRSVLGKGQHHCVRLAREKIRTHTHTQDRQVSCVIGVLQIPGCPLPATPPALWLGSALPGSRQRGERPDSPLGPKRMRWAVGLGVCVHVSWAPVQRDKVPWSWPPCTGAPSALWGASLLRSPLCPTPTFARAPGVAGSPQEAVPVRWAWGCPSGQLWGQHRAAWGIGGTACLSWAWSTASPQDGPSATSHRARGNGTWGPLRAERGGGRPAVLPPGFTLWTGLVEDKDRHVDGIC